MSFTWVIDSGDSVPALGTQVGNVLAVNVFSRAPTLIPSAVRVREVHVPNITWNVTTNNNAIIITIAAVPYSNTIPVGFYTRDALISAVQNALGDALILTTYVPTLAYNTLNYSVNLSVLDTGTALLTPFTLSAPLTVPLVTPSVLFLLGWDEVHNPLVSVTGDETADGPANPDCDRWAFVSCEQTKGMGSAIDSMSPRPWHDGILSTFNLAMPKGEIRDYLPLDDASWVSLVNFPQTGILTFYLNRDYYQYFGPARVYWTMVLEVR